VKAVGAHNQARQRDSPGRQDGRIVPSGSGLLLARSATHGLSCASRGHIQERFQQIHSRRSAEVRPAAGAEVIYDLRSGRMRLGPPRGSWLARAPPPPAKRWEDK